MKIKKKMLLYGLMGWIGIANAFEIGDEIHDTFYSKSIVGDIAVDLGSVQDSGKYRVNIYSVSTKSNDHPQSFAEAVNPVSQTIDKKIWTITLDQLPITQKDCDELISDFCDEMDKNCYQYCLEYPEPHIVAIDDKQRKIYLSYPTKMIGVTGIGPAFLFVGDIDKREIKFLGTREWLEYGSVSSSGRYLILYATSIISIYDTKTYSKFDINKSENDFNKHVLHNLYLIKWISDTQFVYIDRAKYFRSNGEPQPFISAKEITYDIVTKTKLNEKTINESEFERLMKQTEMSY